MASHRGASQTASARQSEAASDSLDALDTLDFLQQLHRDDDGCMQPMCQQEILADGDMIWGFVSPSDIIEDAQVDDEATINSDGWFELDPRDVEGNFTPRVQPERDSPELPVVATPTSWPLGQGARSAYSGEVTQGPDDRVEVPCEDTVASVFDRLVAAVDRYMGETKKDGSE